MAERVADPKHLVHAVDEVYPAVVDTQYLYGKDLTALAPCLPNVGIATGGKRDFINEGQFFGHDVRRREEPVGSASLLQCSETAVVDFCP